jgi:beta-glucosidase
MCLYKNDRSALPLDPAHFTVPGAIFVTGASADSGDNLQGNYAQHTDIGAVSILQGIRNVVGNTTVTFSPGCLSIECANKSGFADALALAQKAQVVVAVLGLEHDCDDDVACEGEGHDRTSIEFAGYQLELAATMRAVGVPLVCVLVHGGSMALRTLLSDCDAIVDAWYPGAQGGNGLAGELIHFLFIYLLFIIADGCRRTIRQVQPGWAQPADLLPVQRRSP